MSDIVGMDSISPKHTPGPWRLNTDAYQGPYVCGEFRAVAQIVHSYQKRLDDEEWANALLIAAAPELLEALRGLLALECPITGKDPFGSAVVSHWAEQKARGHGYADLYLNALAAVAKAVDNGSAT